MAESTDLSSANDNEEALSKTRAEIKELRGTIITQLILICLT